MKKQPYVTENTKRTFAEAFCKLYSSFSIEQITIQKIADTAGYNRCTFYQYFSDVYDIRNYVEDVVLEYMKSNINSLSTVLFQPNVTKLFEFFSKKEIYLRALLGDYGYVHFIARIKNTILNKDEQTENALLPYLAEFHLSTTLSLIRFWLSRERDLPMEELLRLIHNLYLNGVSFCDS